MLLKLLLVSVGGEKRWKSSFGVTTHMFQVNNEAVVINPSKQTVPSQSAFQNSLDSDDRCVLLEGSSRDEQPQPSLRVEKTQKQVWQNTLRVLLTPPKGFQHIKQTVNLYFEVNFIRAACSSGANMELFGPFSEALCSFKQK